MMQLADQYDDVISLGRGDPDLPTPPHIIEAAQKALETGYTHYTSIPGLVDLREAIADKFRLDNRLDFDPDDILVTCGCQEAILLTILTLLGPGEEMVVSDPRYTSYDLAARIAGGRAVTVARRLDDDFRWAPEDVEKAITDRTKLLALISPDNPTGKVMSRNDLEAFAELADKHNLLVMSDEIYEKVVYDGYQHQSIASLPGMMGRTVIINGFSKTYCMTGWRVGYLAGPRDLVKAMYTLKHTLTISTPTVSQCAARAALTGPQEPIEAIRDTFDRRRKTLVKALNETQARARLPNGGTFLFFDIRPTGLTSDEFAVRLLEEARVLVYPGNYFGDVGEGWIRASLFAPTHRIEEAADRLRRAVPIISET
jgi:aminotransferase